MSEQQPWEPGVIARYLTVGGATVELVEKPDEITGNCNGCPDESHTFHFDPCCTGARMERFVTSQASQWAQAHAEKCRALPRPGGAA
ncbi:hypothetical protein ABZT03_38735 [Streptomyces sp. NPDC005574]|uniref:hypothetical protein n=1 Tax=Streptomyces sp. NPDC005574 TaxID=3156891 RepID=UPI0033A69B53